MHDIEFLAVPEIRRSKVSFINRTAAFKTWSVEKPLILTNHGFSSSLCHHVGVSLASLSPASSLICLMPRQEHKLSSNKVCSSLNHRVRFTFHNLTIPELQCRKTKPPKKTPQTAEWGRYSAVHGEQLCHASAQTCCIRLYCRRRHIPSIELALFNMLEAAGQSTRT